MSDNIFRTRKNRHDIYSGREDLIEKTPEWHEWRLKGIGSSDAPAVMEASPWQTPFDIWNLKTKRVEPEPPNEAMKRGLFMQGRALREYQKMTGIQMLSRERLIHPEYDFVRSNFDGINFDRKKLVEIKCPGFEDHRLAKERRIPDKYLWQLVHLLLTTGYDQVDYFSFDGKKGVIVPFRRDESLERQLLEKEMEFWECVQSDTPPGIKVIETQIPNGPKYTVEQIVEIMTKAKQLGITSLKIEGFEAQFKKQGE